MNLINTVFNRWRLFAKTRPTKKGWYICTVEVPKQQRYVMDLYWYPDQQKFIDNRVKHTFDVYEVISGCTGERITECHLIDRTKGVIAWKRIPKTYMKGFVKRDISTILK